MKSIATRYNFKKRGLTWRASFAVVVLSLVYGVLTLQARLVKIELPPETAAFKPATGSFMANGQCLTCHSVEYVQTQPAMPQALWAAEVKKMRDKFGARIPEDQITPLVKYLVENYGVTTNMSAVVATEKIVFATNQPLDAEALATHYGCLSCHKIEVKVVGPAFKDVRAKYLNDPAAQEKIVGQIHNGGSGKWGPAIMPPYITVINDLEARKLAGWIMGPDTSGR